MKEVLSRILRVPFDCPTDICIAIFSPNRRRCGQGLIESFFSQQPEGVHHALSLDVDETSWLDGIATPSIQSIPRLLGHMDAPGGSLSAHIVS